MTLMTFVYLIAGLVLLVAGAEVLVRGAAKLAAQFGIPPLIIGLTVVAFGTSAPETAVSVQAALDGKGDLAIGNVVGSNIANVLFILGLTALIAPLLVSRQIIRLDVPIMIGASLLTWALAWDGSLDRIDGALLFGGIVAYTAFLIIMSRRDKAAAGDEFSEESGTDLRRPGAAGQRLQLSGRRRRDSGQNPRAVRAGHRPDSGCRWHLIA
mgnify:CR=1 FL=1